MTLSNIKQKLISLNFILSSTLLFSFIDYKKFLKKTNPQNLNLDFKNGVFFKLDKPHIFHRYLYALLKFLEIEGVKVYVFLNLKIFISLKKNRYLNRIFNLSNIHFIQSDLSLKFKNVIDNNCLNPDYYSNQLSKNSNSFYIPITLHPSMYDETPWYENIKSNNRLNSIFFVGNFEKKSYEVIDSYPYKIPNRFATIKVLKDKNLLHTFESYEDFIDQKSDEMCIVISTNKFKIPMKEVRKVVSNFNYYLVLPGVVAPQSHNLVEAMSVGTIPIIHRNYNKYLKPKLTHLEDALIYDDLDDLESLIKRCYSLDSKTIQYLSKNVLSHYNNFYTPKAVTSNLLNNNGINFMLTEHYSSSIFKSSLKVITH